MASPAPAGYASLRLCLPASRSNQGGTSRCTIPKRCRPCRKAHSHSAETISPARRRRNRLRRHLSQEIAPAMCWPSICRRDEIRHPTHMFFLTTRRERQIQTPLQSANVFLPKRVAPVRAFHVAPPLIMIVERNLVIGRREDYRSRHQILLRRSWKFFL